MRVKNVSIITFRWRKLFDVKEDRAIIQDDRGHGDEQNGCEHGERRSGFGLEPDPDLETGEEQDGHQYRKEFLAHYRRWGK